MITPAEITKRAERKYRAVLRAWLADEDNFPIEFPVGRLSKDLMERRQDIEALRQHSAEVRGAGYTLQWNTANQRDLGKQTVPQRVIIPSLEDYLVLVRKKTEFNQFASDVAAIRERFPELEAWIQAYPHGVIEHHGQWPDLLVVCAYFVESPRLNVYLRELPIPVHTKFIEENTRILRALLDELLPAEQVNRDATDFHTRFGLKDKPSLVRLRLLEEQLAWQYALQLDDLSLPVKQVAHLLGEHIKPRHVIIVENLINFLTLPRLANSAGLFGGGFAVHLLREVGWLAQCDVIYWGDIDAHGFQILSALRGLFPHVVSVMMDRQTLADNAAYVGAGNQAQIDHYDHLTGAEAELAHHVTTQNLRLEQEHIPHQYAVAQLKQALYREVDGEKPV